MSINRHHDQYAAACVEPEGWSRNVSQFIPPGKDPKDMPKIRHSVKSLFIDSRDRDRTLDTADGPFSFIIYVDDSNRKSLGIAPYEMVHSVELKALNMPKIAGEHYVILDIAELSGQIDSSDVGSNGKTCVAFFDGYDSVTVGRGMEPGSIKTIKGQDVTTRLVEFNPPIPRLNRLTIKLRKYGGAIVQPSDVGGVDYCTMLLQFDVQNRSIH
jgi:hypothetical protein